MDLATALDELRGRRWTHLREYWLERIKAFDSTRPPDPPIDEIPAIELLKNKFIVEGRGGPRGSEGSVFESVPLLPQTMFNEGVFLLHKARHILGAAEMHANDGISTWSLSSAYQGAFFAGKSVC